MANPLITGKIAEKRGKINMKTSKRKEKLSFIYKNQWFKVSTRRLHPGRSAVEIAYFKIQT